MELRYDCLHVPVEPIGIIERTKVAEGIKLHEGP